MKYQIEARHMGLGVVVFTLEATDDKQAFTKWKQVVGNARQWIIRSNVPVNEPTEPYDEL